jgi:hypothetical protein
MYANTLLRIDDASPSTEGVDLRTTLRDGIETPLSALRATLENLAKAFPASDPKAEILGNAVRSVERIARHAQTLADYTIEPRVAPLRCSLEEITRCAYAATPKDVRDRVRLAVEDPLARLFVDGPLFARCLSYLLHFSLDHRDEALLHAQARDSQAVFTVVCVPTPAGESSPPLRPPGCRVDLSDLMLLVAERQFARMGGCLERTRSTSGVQRVSVRFPLESGAGGSL